MKKRAAGKVEKKNMAPNPKQKQINQNKDFTYEGSYYNSYLSIRNPW